MPEAIAMPMHKGRATRKTTTDASNSRGKAAFNCVMFTVFLLSLSHGLSSGHGHVWPLTNAQARAASEHAGRAVREFKAAEGRATPLRGAAGYQGSSGGWVA
ncbi:hypothetical protein BR1R5_30180 [Pseudomonas sp. BR1R-5]|nr:hypothetical protein BR1R5_30180 [Pseudomonas sp. BR1R-5]